MTKHKWGTLLALARPLANQGLTPLEIAAILDCDAVSIRRYIHKGLLPRNSKTRWSRYAIRARWCMRMAITKGFTPEEVGPLFSKAPCLVPLQTVGISCSKTR